MGGRHSMPAAARRRLPSRIVRAGVALVAAVVLGATGAGWWTFHGLLSGLTVSQALGADAPRATGAAVNILLIGLDSRKDQSGDDLPQALLDQLHAGDSTSGGYNTNTLILVHLAADGSVEAVSIPRDDYVNVSGIVPGYHHIKIKQAYGLTKADEQQKLLDDGVTDRSALERQGREAGRTATLAAVRALTGAPIDYFAEINLAGFYDLAASVGGVEVCLEHAVHDDYSGADFPAGHQRLNAQQALAFVRQRHGLGNGDLDRTHRQQAFLISVIGQLRNSGSFSDVGKLNTLIDVARKDIVLSRGWDASLVRRIGALAGGQVQYQTLPVLRYDTVNGQDVNIIDPTAIRALVASTFADSTSLTPTPLAASGVTAQKTGSAGPSHLVAWTKLIGFTDHPTLATCEIDTFRYRVLHVAARITRGARQTRLRIDATLAMGHRHLSSLATTSGRLPLTPHTAVKPTRGTPPALESPPTERHRPSYHTRPAKSELTANQHRYQPPLRGLMQNRG